MAYLDRRAAFFSFGEGEFWIARQGRDILGTIGAAINHAENAETGEKRSVFGFFEVLPNQYEAAQALWDTAADWGRSRGMAVMRGPHSFTGSDEPGFLISGFDTAPAILMSHSPAWYPVFAERYGFHGISEGLAYRLDLTALGPDLENIPPIVRKIADRAISRYGPDVIRNARLADWDEEITRIHPVYNRSLHALNGSTSIQLAEFREQAEGLKAIMDPDLAFIAEIDGRVVGFALGLANINEALIHANGLRWPWDYLRFAAARRHITGVSYKILVMDPSVWGTGLETIMHLRMGKAMLARGYTWMDASITGAENPQTNSIAQKFGAVEYRRYREYQLDL